MKKVFSFVAVALLTVSILFTACRENTTVQEAPAQETAPAPAQEAAPAQDASAAPSVDTTGAQQAQ